jgi:hypothetical protein
MAYDERLAGRIRRVLAGRRDVAEKRMFGGLAFLVGGKMACGVLGRDLVVRVGPDRHEAALARPGARPMDFTGRPLRGFIYVGPAGTRTAAALRRWIADGIAGAAAGPPKRPERGKKGRT